MKRFDAVVCGSCVLDILCRPVCLDTPLPAGDLQRIDPPRAIPGGITANSGITMRRLGLNVAVASRVGDDTWGQQWRTTLEQEGVDSQHLEVADDAPTSTTIVLVDESGERSFLHAQGAPKQIDAGFFGRRADLWQSTRWMLLGYYPLLPNLLDDLPQVMQHIRAKGCKTALDATAGGGSMQPLDKILPHLDLYIPSLVEAKTQTGEDDPETMIRRYRECGATGILGIKLGGKDGVLLSERANQFIAIPSATPPGKVIDTTGAGDCFLAGMIAGLIRGMSIEDAGRLGCETAAQSVTQIGGWCGVEKCPI